MEKKISEDFLIRVDGRMEAARPAQGEPGSDRVQLMTRGSFVLRGGSYFITYRETEATGYQGSTTTVKIAQDGSRVSMIRYGKASTHLVIEKGVRHVCHYDTGYGAITLGVAADEISHQLGPAGGTAHFSYTLDMDPVGFLSRNLVTIQVSPAQQAGPAPDDKMERNIQS